MPIPRPIMILLRKVCVKMKFPVPEKEYAANRFPCIIMPRPTSGRDAVYSLHSFNAFQTAPGIKQYAGEVYNTAVNLNEEPKILLDFLHKNNKNFDFKI